MQAMKHTSLSIALFEKTFSIESLIVNSQKVHVNWPRRRNVCPHRSPAEIILGAVEDSNVTSLNNSLEARPRDRYAAATFSIPQQQTSILSPQAKQTFTDTKILLMCIAAYFDSLDCFILLGMEGPPV
jgi:hypothetical protein